MDRWFHLRTARDLYEKLKWEYEQHDNATGMARVFTAWNFFVTADHIVDWLDVEEKDQGWRTRRKTEKILRIVNDLASGAKHLKIDLRRHGTVKSTDDMAKVLGPYIESTTPVVLVFRLREGNVGSSIEARTAIDWTMDYWKRHFDTSSSSR